MSAEDLKEILAGMAEQNRTMAERNEAQQQQITGLLTAMSKMPGLAAPIEVEVQPAQANPVLVRADKVQRIALGLRKSHKVKDFKHDKNANIRL